MIYKDIAIIIPSLHPDSRLVNTVRGIFDIGFENIILVNDGSSPEYDSFFSEGKIMGATVLKHAVNLGKGRALKTAFNYILSERPDIKGAVTVDGDGQHLPEDVKKCADRLEADNYASLVLGCRNFSEDHVPFKSRYGNRITIAALKLLCGLSVSDSQTGLRGIGREYMSTLMNVKGERFEFETNMLLNAKDENTPISEVVIQTVYLDENKSSHFNPLLDSIKIYALFGKYLFASLSSWVVDIVLFSIFVAILSPRSSGLGYITVATILARIISAVYNYTVNNKLVFKSKASTKKSFSRYATLAVCQLLVSALLVTLIFKATSINESIIKICVDGVLFVLSYFIQREWVFKDK